MGIGMFKEKIMNGETMDRFADNIIGPKDEGLKIDFNHSDHIMLQDMKSMGFNKDLFKGFDGTDNMNKMKSLDFFSKKKNNPMFNFSFDKRQKPKTMEIFGIYEEYNPKRSNMRMDEKLDVFGISPGKKVIGKNKPMDMKAKMDMFGIGKHKVEPKYDFELPGDVFDTQKKLSMLTGMGGKRRWNEVINIDRFSRNEETQEGLSSYVEEDDEENKEEGQEKGFVKMAGAAAKEIGEKSGVALKSFGEKIGGFFSRQEEPDIVQMPANEEQIKTSEWTRRQIENIEMKKKYDQPQVEKKVFDDVSEEQKKSKWKTPLELLKGVQKEREESKARVIGGALRKKAMLYNIPDSRGKLPEKAYKLDKNYLGYLLWQAQMAKATKRKNDPLWAVRQAGMMYGIDKKTPSFGDMSMSGKTQAIQSLSGMTGMTGMGLGLMSSGVATGAGLSGFGERGYPDDKLFARQPSVMEAPIQSQVRLPQKAVSQEPYQYSDVTIREAPGTKGPKFSPYSKRVVSYIRGPYRKQRYYAQYEQPQ